MVSLGWPRLPDSLKIVGDDRLGQARRADEFFKELPQKFTFQTESLKPNIIVIDSLNVLGNQIDWNGLNVFRAIESHLKDKCWILVLVQNWEHDCDHDPSFAFMADIETRFYVKTTKDYFLNYIRIVKMRFQEHARGEHLLKVYGAPTVATAANSMPAWDRIGLDRKKGGVYIMPSIHRHLSGLGDAPSIEARSAFPANIEVPINGLNNLLELGKNSAGESIFGLPKHCCTTLIGARGAMKSHVAYLTLIKHLQQGNGSTYGIMLSLRDDVVAAVNTLEQICVQEGTDAKLIQGWRDESRLDIVYFPPGYLPPHEFMHRVYVSIEGMVRRHEQSDGREILCVLNGIDHLAARHPLCAEEKMFVPALICYMTRTFVTSIVIAADDARALPGDARPVDDAGLLPMAELLIRFKTVEQGKDMEEDLGRQLTKVSVQRVPAGATSGRFGYLFRDDRSSALKFARTLQEAMRSWTSVEPPSPDL
jgi:hypothetical protein